jgi:phage repressor protein C with HTH and peptisase S24 domain
MPPRDKPRPRPELVRFARRVLELKRAWEAANPHNTFKVGSTLSRILALVPEYDSGRIRKRETSRGPAKAPTIFTAHGLANRLGVPICALFESKDHRVFSDAQIEQIREDLGRLLSTFSSPTSFANDFENVEPFETVQKPAYDFAAGRSGIEGDFAAEPHDVFRGIHGISSDRFGIITVNGDSMSPLLLPGDRVLIDTSLTHPRNGVVVAVFSASHGRVIGYWQMSGKQCFLRKENHDYSRIALGDPQEWRVLGTITSYIHAPLSPEDRLLRSL